jgi:hypothetical protein
MTEPAGLATALDASAAELEDVAFELDETDRRTWRRDGVEFAILDGSTVELRIGSTIAAAAVRTPDTSPSGRGPDWVTFTPPILDDHARDRLEAWFAAAHRRAVPGA